MKLRTAIVILLLVIAVGIWFLACVSHENVQEVQTFLGLPVHYKGYPPSGWIPPSDTFGSSVKWWVAAVGVYVGLSIFVPILRLPYKLFTVPAGAAVRKIRKRNPPPENLS